MKSHLRTILLWLYCHDLISSSTTAKAIKLFKLEAGDE